MTREVAKELKPTAVTMLVAEDLDFFAEVRSLDDKLPVAVQTRRNYA